MAADCFEKVFLSQEGWSTATAVSSSSWNKVLSSFKSMLHKVVNRKNEHSFITL
jgi:hypothetical protein